jgi:hypothetical protein
MRYTLVIFLILIAFPAFAQDAPMADILRQDGKIWVVVATLSIVLLGFIVYLVRLDGRITKLENNKKA